jgi:hypothetical protein
MLRSPEGLVFGIGKAADRAFWVEIEVIAPAVNNRYSYDFAANYCSAGWRSSTGRLACPGGSDSPDGAVILLDQPELENGRIEDELTLWTRPDKSLEGWISGDYPAYQVKSGDHFLADIGCLAESDNCDVIFSLSYRIDGGPIRNLGTWREAHDGGVTRIDLDLSALAGQQVQFILGVENWGKPEEANAFWLAPSIRNLGTGLEWTPAAQAARQKLAVALGLDPITIAFKSVWATEWADSCLGVHLPDQVCAPAVVSGLRVVMTAGNRDYEAHTNADGSNVIWFEL